MWNREREDLRVYRAWAATVEGPVPAAGGSSRRGGAKRKKKRATAHKVFVKSLASWRPDANPERYEAWRSAVLQAAQWHCQGCGKQGVTLHAHHVLEWRDNVRHRYDVSNGRSLCLTCHEAIHGRTFR